MLGGLCFWECNWCDWCDWYKWSSGRWWRNVWTQRNKSRSFWRKNDWWIRWNVLMYWCRFEKWRAVVRYIWYSKSGWKRFVYSWKDHLFFRWNKRKSGCRSKWFFFSPDLEKFVASLVWETSSFEEFSQQKRFQLKKHMTVIRQGKNGWWGERQKKSSIIMMTANSFFCLFLCTFSVFLFLFLMEVLRVGSLNVNGMRDGRKNRLLIGVILLQS